MAERDEKFIPMDIFKGRMTVENANRKVPSRPLIKRRKPYSNVKLFLWPEFPVNIL
jgi:hypothetical protein